MLDFDNVKNDITFNSNNLENILGLNSFNPIVTFFNFYREYLPYIKEDTYYDDLVPGGIYKLNIVDFDDINELGLKHYTITPYKSNLICSKFLDNNKLFTSSEFERHNSACGDRNVNILFTNILSKYAKHILKVDVKYFDLFAVYTIRYKIKGFDPIIYLTYRPDIEISELLSYIYNIYDVTLYNEINNEIKSCNFDYYNSYYKYICEIEKMKPELDSVFNDVRRGSIVYFKYNDEHYFIKQYPEITSLNDILLFNFQEELHHKNNNFTHTYTINPEDPFSEMKIIYVTSPCELPEFFKYILRGKLTVYKGSLTILKVKFKK